MHQEDVKNLIKSENMQQVFSSVPEGLMAEYDKNLEDLSSSISPEVYGVFKKFAPMKSEAPDAMKENLFNAIRGYIGEKTSEKAWVDVLFLYRFLIGKSELIPGDYYEISRYLLNTGNKNLSVEFFRLYELKETNRPLKLLTAGNFYNLELKDYKNAIKYYEKYLKIDETKPVIYTILASLYAKAYGDLSLKDQIYYFSKAYALKPQDRLVLHGLAFCCEKFGDKTSALRYYKELLANNPTETDYYNYGAFLISCGEFVEGHKYFSHRFMTGDKNFEYPLAGEIEKKWDFKDDISDKVLLIHWEQGFGDTFMYCRFVPMMRKFAKKIIFVVQEELADLVGNSSLITEGIEVVTSADGVNYDYSIALLDTVYALGITVDEIPFRDGYLEVPEKMVNEYGDKYIKKSSNLKVGLAYSGDKNANYNGRDIEFNRLRNIINVEGVDFYSLQVDNAQDETGVVSLGETFKDFTNTACAIKNMDIVISTDNVILNLAGALGVKTIGMFNRFPNFRWYKLDGEDTGWYKSVMALQVEETDCWRDVFAGVRNILAENTKLVIKK